MGRQFVVVFGSLAVATLVLTASVQATQDASPTDISRAGISIENVLSTPPLVPLPPATSVTLRRITFQAGASLELAYRGPVIYYVESGTLAIRFSPHGSQVILSGGSSSPSAQPGALASGETVLSAGFAILAEDGMLGPTRNAGADPVVVLAVLLVPEFPSEGEQETVEEIDVHPGTVTPNLGERAK